MQLVEGRTEQKRKGEVEKVEEEGDTLVGGGDVTMMPWGGEGCGNMGERGCGSNLARR